jgi:hypothetical protein
VQIVERHWYERNKHIFPASRWEIFDPEADYGERLAGAFPGMHVGAVGETRRTATLKLIHATTADMPAKSSNVKQ